MYRRNYMRLTYKGKDLNYDKMHQKNHYERIISLMFL